MLVMAGCSTTAAPPPGPGAPASTPAGTKARELVAKGSWLLDVRTPAEFSAGHIDGALNIPLDALEQRMGELEPRDRPIVVYCRSGSRSAGATQLLKRAGFAQVFDLGAMRNW